MKATTDTRPLTPEDLAAQPLFADLPAGTLDRIAAVGSTVAHARRGRVLDRGDTLDGLYVVLEGSLKLYMLSCAGDERVLRIMGPGDSFGEAIMFNRMPSPVFVEALTASRLGYLPRDVIVDVLTRAPDFGQQMLRSMSGLMHQLIMDLEACCLQNAQQRAAAYLLRMVDHNPPTRRDVRLPATKAVVASMLNMSAETFSRELHRLQKHGIIEIDRRRIRVRDRDRLAALAFGTASPSAR